MVQGEPPVHGLLERLDGVECKVRGFGGQLGGRASFWRPEDTGMPTEGFDDRKKNDDGGGVGRKIWQLGSVPRLRSKKKRRRWLRSREKRAYGGR